MRNQKMQMLSIGYREPSKVLTVVTISSSVEAMLKVLPAGLPLSQVEMYLDKSQEVIVDGSNPEAIQYLREDGFIVKAGRVAL